MTKALGRGKKARSFSGCKCCKQAKRKCPEERPQCSICEKLGLKCEVCNFSYMSDMTSMILTFYFGAKWSISLVISQRPHVSHDLVSWSSDFELTWSDPAKRPKRDTAPATTSYDSQSPLSPKKYIQYQFIDESAALMSPTHSHDARSPSPFSSVESTSPAIGLLLKAAHEEDLKQIPAIPTPPQSPPEMPFLEHKRIFAKWMSLTCLVIMDKPLPSSLQFILNWFRCYQSKDRFWVYNISILLDIS